MSPRPSKIVCVGRSYAEHAQELGNAIPDSPVLFIKPPSSLISLEEGITWNKDLGNLHHECELTLRLDQPLKNETDPQKALEAIGAVTLGLDLTLRDLQESLKKKVSRGNVPKHLMVPVYWQIGWMLAKLKRGMPLLLILK